ncbi:hypothetical protein HEK616_64240 [Streptomyces nigrescens]|uniref:Uncharacterized protein n=1 Tax=Streptomyces nigrescens TaxID=1920 RepID=A0ABM8A2S6_STRNI|nr:hypothetical protein HEK616_64240 [Streptomyces nigrescens]
MISTVERPDISRRSGAITRRAESASSPAVGSSRTRTRVEAAEEGGEHEQLAEGHPARGDLPDAEPDDGQHTDRLDHLDELGVELAHPGPAHRGAQPRAGLGRQPPLLRPFPAVRLGEHDVAEGFLDDHLLDGLDVSGEPGDEIALPVVLEEVRRQQLDVPEDPGP